ncbi:sensor histidine kinase [Tenacibaculum crassostreae]|uniref:sensor histidine kinase n=1 Tax=Tenacibaculum crassostreae TaxID=502683 RepID=UPI003893DB4C
MKAVKSCFVWCFMFSLFWGMKLSAQNNVYKHYTTEQGLPHDITYQLIQDSQGYIWIGTDDGLVKFNGEKFKVFTSENGLKSNFVIDVIEDVKNEQFLIATWGRGLHILKNDSVFKKEPLEKDYSKINKLYQLNDSLIYSCSSSRGVLYDLNGHKTSSFKVWYNERKELILKKTKVTDKPIRDVNYEFVNGKLHLFDSELNITSENKVRGIYVFEGENFIRRNFSGLNNKLIHALTESKGYYVVSSYTSLFFYDRERFLEKRNPKLPSGKIIQMQFYKGKLYFVFINQENGFRELYSYDIQNDFTVNISKNIGIKSSISDFLFDKDANLWITTYGDGVYQLLNTNNNFYDQKYFSNPDLRDVSFLDEKIVIAAPNVIYSVDNDTLVRSKKIPFHTEVFQVEKNNQINIVTANISNKTYKTKLGSLDITNRVHKKFHFKYQNKIVTITDFSFSIEEDKEVLKKGEFHLVEGYYVHHAFQHKKYVYAIFGRLGIFRLDITTGEVINWTDSLAIEANMFVDIINKDNNLWIAANNGIFMVTEGEIVHYTTKNGLSSNHINDLFVDSHNVLWVATQKGLNVLNENDFYSIDNNLGQKSLSVEKITEFNNNLYVAGNKGLFKLDNLHPFKKQSNTYLKINQQHTSFDIATINFVNPNTVKIQYKLNNDDWKETSDTKLEFKNLNENDYELVFRYKDGLSDWKYTQLYKFKITKLWFKQLWFYILLVLCGSGAVTLAVYTQLVKVRKKNKIFRKTIQEREKLQEDLKNVRHQIAQDFHDDLGNKLASISMLSNLSLKKTEKESNLYPSLHQINKDANFLYAGMRDFVWSLDYKNNKLHEVQMYLNDFGEKLFEYSNINFKSTNNVAKSDITLPHYWNKQLVLVFKEAMTNALKHSKATEVLFSVYLNKDILEIKLEDNGVGFDLNASGRKNGLRNMKERITSINGELNIQTTNGFSVCFKGNINE